MYTVSIKDYNTTPGADTPVMSDEELYIYDPSSTAEELMITDPILSIKASQAGEFSCTIPETNYGYGAVVERITRVIVRKDGKIIYMGRVSDKERDLYLNEKIESEGALTYLNDTLTQKKVYTSYDSTPATLFNILSDVFTYHNSKFPNEPWKQFNLTQENCHAWFKGRDTYDINSQQISYYSINYYTTMDVVSELLTLANAVLKLEYNETSGKWDVYIYERYTLPLNETQAIEFGVNLLDFVQEYENNISTAVAPFGGDLIQEPKEIGEVVAGITNQYILLTTEPSNWSTNYTDYYIQVENQYTHDIEYQHIPSGESAPAFEQDTYYKYEDDPNHIYNHVLFRDKNNWAYMLGDVSNDPEYANSGYWAYEFDIAGYNAAHPDNKLKRLYLSWRAYKFDFRTDYICDCAWTIVERITYQGGQEDHNLATHLLKNGEDFESAINEVIDLSDPTYAQATHILLGGWGGLIKPTIRRDALIVEENDKLTIEKCDAFTTDTDGLSHPAGSPYLYSDTLINTYGLIEKKLEYDIEDENKPVNPFNHPYAGPLGGTAVYNQYALGYNAGAVGSDPDMNSNKGNYQIIPFPSCKCIEYEIPSLGNPNRPRGVFLSSRMYSFGIQEYGGIQWVINGMYVLLDESHQVLSYKLAPEVTDGVAFTTIQNEFIDLSDAQNYGAKWLRVGGYEGSGFAVTLVPSDDAYSRDRLMTQARSYLTNQQWEKVVIEATAVDLSLTGEQWESFDICTNVEVYSDYHGIKDTYFPVTSLDIQLDDFENNKITLGYDNDEYLSNQLSENLRIMSIEQAIEQKRREST